MKRLTTPNVLWAVAAGVFAVTLVITAANLGRARQAAEGLARRRAAYTRLQDLARAGAPARRAVKAFAALGSEAQAPAVFPLPSAPGAGGGPQAEDVRYERKPCGQDWQVVRATVVFRDAPLRAVMQMVDQASAQRPPWRLESCDIRGSPRGPGLGQATLVLATIRRQAPP